MFMSDITTKPSTKAAAVVHWVVFALACSEPWDPSVAANSLAWWHILVNVALRGRSRRVRR